MFLFSATSNWLEELDVSWNHLRQRGAIGMAKGLEVISIYTLLMCISQLTHIHNFLVKPVCMHVHIFVPFIL